MTLNHRLCFFSPLIIINYSIVSPESSAHSHFLPSKLADKWSEQILQSLAPSLPFG